MAIFLWARSSKSRAFLWMHVPRRDFVRRDFLAPRGCHAFGSAPGNLDHEAATVSVELDRQQIDLIIPEPAEVWERTFKPSFSQGWNEQPLQRCNHGIRLH